MLFSAPTSSQRDEHRPAAGPRHARGHARQYELAWSTAGKALLGIGVTAAVGTAAGRAFANFDAAMNNVLAARPGEAVENMQRLREAALRAGADTAFPATEPAAGIENLAQSGRFAA